MRTKRILNGLVIRALLAIYVYALFKIILFKFRAIDVVYLREQLMKSLTHPEYVRLRMQEGNLTLFKEISRTIHVSSPHEVIYMVGNIALFIPFGIFLGLLSANRKISLVGALIYSLGLSLVLEGSQVVFVIGTFDVDDLLLNAFGGMLGCIVFKCCEAMAGARPSGPQEDQIQTKQAAAVALHVER